MVTFNFFQEPYFMFSVTKTKNSKENENFVMPKMTTIKIIINLNCKRQLDFLGCCYVFTKKLKQLDFDFIKRYNKAK